MAEFEGVDMLKRNRHIVSFAVTLLLAVSLVPVGAMPARARSAQRDNPTTEIDGDRLASYPSSGFVIEWSGDGAACRAASPEESNAFAGRDRFVPLHIISPIREAGVSEQDAGLNIILRGTPQLENFPQAKNAFLRAAKTWEAVIRSSITIIVDVDFGPTRFGEPFDNPNILGSTDTQDIGSNSLYPTVRSRLLAQASSPREAGLYNALPVGALPTDLGSAAAVIAPSAVFRALGIIGSIADPATETATLGPPPAIGFNSAFRFDFDPSDGITSGKTDFDATAVHELGHALGFTSNVGTLELNPRAAVAPSVLDLLRFRPGVTLPTFPSALRIQSSGGTQVFFAGEPELLLSTGRGDATGGDGRQASHWKDDELIGQYVGIMDPTLDEGRRETITSNDLLALDSMGFQVGPLNGGGDTVALTSGVNQQGSIRAPKANEEDAVIDDRQYAIQVPASATQLRVELDGNQDIDLYVRAAQRVTINSSGLQADYVSNSPTGHETITITSSSSPALRAATYYIAVLNYGPGSVNFNLKATISGPGGGGSNSPVINSLKGELDGDNLILTGVASDSNGDIVQAQSNLLDGSGEVVGQTAPFSVNFGTSTTTNFTLTVSNMSAIPAAVMATVVFIDRSGNHSAPQTADFSQGDSGGPTVSGGSYNSNKLIIKGSGFSAQVLIEINGVVVGIYQSSTERKIKVKGNPSRLNLRAGPNRVRVLNGNSRSNLFVLDL
ncbi:MAG TPA: NF038122 family metalloprotease [Blastocatellia bacterium]|nr:NF038122 family metalloprotease [Blastocatellia bacterium]